MSKNRRFKNVYTVTIEGTTTNGFAAAVLDRLIKQIVPALSESQKQTNTTIEVKETNGDYNAITEVRDE